MVRVVEVKVIEPYRIWVRFDDDLEGTLDLSPMLDTGIFQQLRDPALFEKAQIDQITHTVTWPNGIDLCPDSLYQDIKSQQLAA